MTAPAATVRRLAFNDGLESKSITDNSWAEGKTVALSCISRAPVVPQSRSDLGTPTPSKSSVHYIDFRGEIGLLRRARRWGENALEADRASEGRFSVATGDAGQRSLRGTVSTER